MPSLSEIISNILSKKDPQIPRILPCEIGSTIRVGKKGREVPVESLDENRISPMNDPHPTGKKRSRLLPWPGQGDQADTASEFRPTEDRALDNAEEDGY